MTDPTTTHSTEPGGSLPRRRALFAAVAVGAVLAGAGLAWWRHALRDGDAGAVQALWQLEFDTPSGGKLQMSTFRGRSLEVAGPARLDGAVARLADQQRQPADLQLGAGADHQVGVARGRDQAGPGLDAVGVL